MTKDLRRSDCPIHCALNLVGDRWTLIIVRDLLGSPRATFGELLEADEGIATNTLASRLKNLEEAGIVEQLPDDKRYLLTEKGLDLAPLLVELTLFSMRYEEDVDKPNIDLHEYRKNPTLFVEKIKKAARGKRAAIAETV